MSVSVIVKLKVDPAALEKVFASRKADFEAVSAQAKAAGAIHHYFGAGDGEVAIVDEWDSAASFHAFFDNPKIGEIMAEAGVEGPPVVTVYEIMDSPDRF